MVKVNSETLSNYFCLYCGLEESGKQRKPRLWTFFEFADIWLQNTRQKKGYFLFQQNSGDCEN